MCSFRKLLRVLVEGGHRAIIFNRIGGVDQNTIHSEGLHFRYTKNQTNIEFENFSVFFFRVPWFQYPIVYDIRARPSVIRSPTGSKGSSLAFFSCRQFTYFRIC